MARNVRQVLLAAGTCLFAEIGARGARNVVFVASMVDLWMTAGPAASTLSCAGRRPSTTGQRGLEDGLTAVAAYLVENCFRATGTWSPMATGLTSMAPALERASASLQANVLCFNGSWLIPILLLRCPPLSALIPRTAMLSAPMTSATLVGLTDLQTPRLRDVTLVAEGFGLDPAAPAVDFHHLLARRAVVDVTLGVTKMAAGQELIASLLTMRYLVRARLSRVVHELVERRLAARAFRDHIRCQGAMCCDFVLRMTPLRALVNTTVILSCTHTSTIEFTEEPFLFGDAV